MSDMTLDVLAERVDNAVNLLHELRGIISDSDTGLAKIHATQENHEARIHTLEQWHTWLLRTVFGTIIVAGLSVVAIVWAAINSIKVL